MSESPILFSGPMVRAILDGRKTVTRRIVKPQPLAETPFYRGSIGTYSGATRPRHFWGRYPDWDAFQEAAADGGEEDILWPGGDDDGFTCDMYAAESGLACPYGAAANDLLREGDRLWVRETWGYRGSSWTLGEEHKTVWIEYAADGGKADIQRPRDDDSGLPQPRDIRPNEDYVDDYYNGYLNRYWKQNRPSIHMPRWASRITLEVTGVRVERLQDISDGDCWDEGIQSWLDIEANLPRYSDGTPAKYNSAKQAFSAMWAKINGAGSWDANPWVWVVEFRRIEQEARDGA